MRPITRIRLAALKACLEEHKGEEHLLYHWLRIVNQRITPYYRYQNCLALSRGIRMLKYHGHEILNRYVYVRVDGETKFKKRFYTYRGVLNENKT